ncbi:hypothetical protein [Thalassospira alkalitolerans]|uniref:hypothetical protein n=1 Tax=Thalassospira alkalitolerans TaxID=1293890 RepID=UPI003AA9D2CE
MSKLAIKAMRLADRMENGPYVHLKETRDLLNECSDQLDAFETHETALNQMIDDKDALIAELVGALECCRTHLNKQWKSEADPSSGFSMLTDDEMALSIKMDTTLTKAKDQTNDR